METSKRASITPLLGLFFAVLAVSTASPMIRFAQREASSLVIAAYRLGLATLVLSPFALVRYRQEILTTPKAQIKWLFLSGFLLALHFGSWITSLGYTSVTSSVVLVSTTPLWVALLSPLFLKEPVGRLVVIGLIVALVGGTIVSLGRSCAISFAGISCQTMESFLYGREAFGNFLALIGAWCGAGYLVAGRKLRFSYSLIPYTFLVYGTAAFFLLSGALISGQKMLGYSINTTLLFIGLALIPQILGHSTFNWALRYLSAAFVSITLLGEPIGSSILALVLLGESPTGLELIGGILILAGIYLSTLSEVKK